MILPDGKDNNYIHFKLFFWSCDFSAGKYISSSSKKMFEVHSNVPVFKDSQNMIGSHFIISDLTSFRNFLLLFKNAIIWVIYT